MGLDIYLGYDNSSFGRKHYKRNVLKDYYDKNVFIVPDRYDILQEEPSDSYPDHLCNKMYLRSSYNSAGYNSLARLYNCMSLYDIFEPIFIDDWNTECTKEALLQCLDNAKRNEQMWLSLDDKMFDIFPIQTYTERHKSQEEPSSIILTRKTGLDAFNKLYNKKDPYVKNPYNISTYSKDGLVELYSNPIEIYGIINNVVPEFAVGRPNAAFTFGEQCVVYARDISWYKQMACIIVEFIETALQIDYPSIFFWG